MITSYRLYPRLNILVTYYAIISLMMLLNEKLGIYTCVLTFWQGCTVDVVGVLNLCYLSFCMCFHDTCLWRQHSSALRGFKSAYHRCLKLFFNYNRYDSVTNMLYFLGLPSFNTVIINARLSLCVYWSQCAYTLVCDLYSLHIK